MYRIFGVSCESEKSFLQNSFAYFIRIFYEFNKFEDDIMYFTILPFTLET